MRARANGAPPSHEPSLLLSTYVSSSIGRAAVSKTAGWGFESLLTCTAVGNGNRALILYGNGSAMKEKIVNLFQDIVREMKKVTWPSREELQESTKIVILVSLLIAAFTYVVDLAVSNLLSLILKG